MFARCWHCLHYCRRTSRCFNELMGEKVPMAPDTPACRQWKGATGQADENAIIRLFLDGYSYQEIASRIGVSRNAISGVLFRRGINADMRSPVAKERAKKRNKQVVSEKMTEMWGKRREGAAG